MVWADANTTMMTSIMNNGCTATCNNDSDNIDDDHWLTAQQQRDNINDNIDEQNIDD